MNSTYLLTSFAPRGVDGHVIGTAFYELAPARRSVSLVLGSIGDAVFPNLCGRGVRMEYDVGE
jgi:hypothetical protein